MEKLNFGESYILEGIILDTLNIYIGTKDNKVSNCFCYMKNWNPLIMYNLYLTFHCFYQAYQGETWENKWSIWHQTCSCSSCYYMLFTVSINHTMLLFDREGWTSENSALKWHVESNLRESSLTSMCWFSKWEWSQIIDIWMIFIFPSLKPCSCTSCTVCAWSRLPLSLSLTPCPGWGGWGRAGGAVFFSLHFVSSCLLLEAAVHYCSGG